MVHDDITYEQYIETIKCIYILYNSCRLNSQQSLFQGNFKLFTKIIEKAKKLFKEEPATILIDTINQDKELVIVGDIHGNLESLLRIFLMRGCPPDTRYLFLGDLVDRGNNSCEVILLLYTLKCLYNDCIYIIRGNHEFRDMTDNYGFKNECNKRIKLQMINNKNYSGNDFYEQVTDTFKELPICAILDDKTFCVHGGISALIKNRDELMKLKKVGDYFCFEDSVQAEFLWNDPDCSIYQYQHGTRGIGCIFGESALNDFLSKMNLEMVIRGHQSENEGYNWPFDNDKLLTIFSSADYCGMGNDGGYVIYSDNIKEKVKIFKIEMIYERLFIPIPKHIIENNISYLEIDQHSNLLLDSIPMLIDI